MAEKSVHVLHGFAMCTVALVWRWGHHF